MDARQSSLDAENARVHLYRWVCPTVDVVEAGPQLHQPMRRARTIAVSLVLVAFAAQGAAPALAERGFFGVHDAATGRSARRT